LAKNAPLCGDDPVGKVTTALGLSNVPVNGVLIVIAAVPTYPTSSFVGSPAAAVTVEFQVKVLRTKIRIGPAVVVKRSVLGSCVAKLSNR
jgi:Na+/pantothenate symporter